MAERPKDLPEFGKPPLIEVALSVQFDELERYRIVHAGLLWQRFRDRFPVYSEHPPLQAAFETFGPGTRRGVDLSVSVVSKPPVPRLWFASRDESQLLQFQSDRLVHNWRKTVTDEGYPRYEQIKARFLDDIAELGQFLIDEDIGEITPNQCEVTYVNHIVTDGSLDIRGHPEVALRILSHPASPARDDPLEWLPEPEDLRIAARFVIKNDKEDPVGRLYVQSEPGIDQDDRSILRLQLVARGAPTDRSIEGVECFSDLGRDAIVRAFTAITTPQMHSKWERTQ